MTALLFLIPLALLLGLAGLAGFMWSVRSGQFDDLDGAAVRVLYDDGKPLPAVPDQTAPSKEK
ncbi:cbb3-type cytochrome oxidase assembly protein CcoS [Niveispirillum sp. SYP-B3756]|jgi:cbb3-type cytochrome oxidase maturation protein|uniref:cbb3-type cytochrome oxidase assembly protein CcoS n=1 Tax=Niveispirillum sp. SYP-B3756 TaxID=2662178 RepID=UPI00129092F9|nr:cbb3-type cytochrome oxidase assembly protein CcoS [Niveispirillum sp. SYP-B3756]MQP67573.1 cbb3-type cytochrome oxidase assembly protein CcoS [Niveispirillum sp. SYP-B3756]